MNKAIILKKHLPLIVIAAVLFLLIVCPLIMIFAKAVIRDGRLDFMTAWQTLKNSENAQMIGNSLLLGLLVVIVSTVIAAPLAYLFSRTRFAKYRFFDVIFMIPFMTPPYIASMGWILFMQKRGLLQQMLPASAGSENWFFSLLGLVLVMSFHVFPFMLTMLKNAMLNIPSSLEESGAVFGAGFGKRMRKIFVPLLSGNYAIGALLVFVKTIAEYGTPATLGKRIGFNVFTTEIHRYATISPIDFGKSATLASVLVGICLVMWMLQNYMLINNLDGEYEQLLVSPNGIKSAVCRLIDEQIVMGTAGYVCIKANSITEREVIDKLMEASQAGVEIQLIIRGICCILPGVPTYTEHISVTSIVGRYLEHARIYCFGKGDGAKLYIASADMMTRNLNRRVEIACPVYDRELKEQLKWILSVQLQDNKKASFMMSDGLYARKQKQQFAETDSQEQFMKLSPHKQNQFVQAKKNDRGRINRIFKRLFKNS